MLRIKSKFTDGYVRNEHAWLRETRKTQRVQTPFNRKLKGFGYIRHVIFPTVNRFKG